MTSYASCTGAGAGAAVPHAERVNGGARAAVAVGRGREWNDGALLAAKREHDSDSGALQRRSA